VNRYDHARTRDWASAGTQFFLQQLDRVADADLAQPSLLPRWSRAHVAGHLARNADALSRLVHWARTGIETPMYRDPEQRQHEIEQTARRAPSQLRDDVRVTAQRLDEAMQALDDKHWDAKVRSAKGRLIPAAEIPWMRVREVWLHAIDLAAGASIADVPPDVVDTLLDDVTGSFTARDGMPALLLTAMDRDRQWEMPGDDPTRVAGPAAALLAWVVGRSNGYNLDAAGGHLPTLPAWL
jgi:maleylpyruvate isomerase